MTGSTARTRFVGGSLLAQGIAVAAWWAALRSPAVRRRFEIDPDAPERLDSFVLADAVVLVAGSTAAGIGAWRGRTWAGPLSAGVAGASLYATLLLAGEARSVGWQEGTRNGVAAMTAGTVVATTVAVVAVRS